MMFHPNEAAPTMKSEEDETPKIHSQAILTKSKARFQTAPFTCRPIPQEWSHIEVVNLQYFRPLRKQDCRTPPNLFGGGTVPGFKAMPISNLRRRTVTAVTRP